MYPYVAAYSGAGWNSPECGSCWRIEWYDREIFVTAIDRCE